MSYWQTSLSKCVNTCTVFSPAITAIKSVVVWVISIVKDCVLKYKNTLRYIY